MILSRYQQDLEGIFIHKPPPLTNPSKTDFIGKTIGGKMEAVPLDEPFV